MKAGPIEVGTLLQNRNRYCVPIYQRHYVWDKEKQWEPFWNDIRTKAIERLEGRERRFSHFMGAVVLEMKGKHTAKRVPSFQVVDGQQRLTTFQLFLAAARDFAASLGHQTACDTIRRYMLNGDSHLMEEPEVEVYKVWPTQADREMFIDIINLGRTGLREKYPNLFYKNKNRDQVTDYKHTPKSIRAYGYFYDQIRRSVMTDDLEDEFTEISEVDEDETGNLAAGTLSKEAKLDAIWQSLVEEFKVVEIVLEDGDDAQVIFETLNERGEPLLAADLVRNNIFQRVEGNVKSAETLFNTHWKPFEEEFWSVEEKQGRYKKPRIEFFLVNFIAGQIGGETSLAKLFSEYKSFVRNRRYASVEDELKELGRYGAIYRALIQRETTGALGSFGKRLLPWDVTTVFPLVLRLWASSMSDADKSLALNHILSFIVRRAICGLTPKNYNKFFISAVSSLDENGWSAGHLARFLMKQSSNVSRWPKDEEFEEHWIRKPTYTLLGSTKTRAILEEIEKHSRGALQEGEGLKADLTVEHILPSSWTASWPLSDGSVVAYGDFLGASLHPEDGSMKGQIVRRERLKHNIGNLILLTQPLNSTVSNGPFPAKREALKDHSILLMSREITKAERWDEAQIEYRARLLLKTAKTIWLYPAAVE
jgi:uncharacterized protein with ParB-like and HNH nuclease domain